MIKNQEKEVSFKENKKKFEQGKKIVAIIATFDTKEREIQYLKNQIQELGAKAFLIDVGYTPCKNLVPDISRKKVMGFSSTDWKQPGLNRKEVISGLADGMEKLLPNLYERGLFDGVIAIGGAQNTIIAVAGMKELAIGIPKIMVSTVANGERKFGDIVGTKDIVVMPSIADFSGINPVTTVILRNAAAAIVGMVKNQKEIAKEEKIHLGATMMGVVDSGFRQINHILEKENFIVTSFHSTGIGGKIMEELVEQDIFDGIIDFSLHEITSEYFGIGYSTGAENRLVAASNKGIPQVVVPGTIDFIDFFSDQIPEHMKSRQMIYHNSNVVHVKLSPDEMRDIAVIISKRLNKSNGPVSVVVPTLGFRSQAGPGEALYDKEADDAFISALEENLKSHIKLTKVKAGINDAEFTEIVAREVISLMGHHLRQEKYNRGRL